MEMAHKIFFKNVRWSSRVIVVCNGAQKKSNLINFNMRKVHAQLSRSNCNSAGMSAFSYVRHRHMKADEDMDFEKRDFFFFCNVQEFLTSTNVRKILASLNSFHGKFKIALGQGASYFTKKYVSFVTNS